MNAQKNRAAVRACVSSLLLLACSRERGDSTPEGVVRLWVEQMEASRGDPSVTREAYKLLSPAARENLQQRAVRAGRMHGRQFDASEMIADGFFGIRFRPKAMRSTVHGDTATVAVFGENESTERALIPCVREGAAWRIDPSLP